MTPMAQMSLDRLLSACIKNVQKRYVHWLPVAGLLEDFRGHVTGGTAGCSQNMKLLLIHDSRQTKIGDE